MVDFHLMMCEPTSTSWLPLLQRNIAPYQLLGGFVVGLVLQPLVRAYKLYRRYPRVTGVYAVQMESHEGKKEHREGEIRIKRNIWAGSFGVKAFHLSGKPQWQGEMYLSLEVANAGTGVYWHVDQDRGVGDQKFRYLPDSEQFRVQAVTFHAGNREPFFHLWTKKKT
jgi:hypothetical protein